ncbi:MAG: archease [Candidatus Limnocylindrales bacterium]|jgi:SHS2 domain-containing protein
MVHRGRSHGYLPHTADAGLVARAPTLAGLFEEAALALAELAADNPGVEGAPVPAGPLNAGDLGGLAFAWLNELIGLAESAGQALVGATVTRLDRAGDGWIVEGRALLAPWGEAGLQARRHVKAVTFHRLVVEEGPAGFALAAYVDL